MKTLKLFIFVGLLLVSNLLMAQRIVDYSVCDALKTDEERRTSYASGSASSSWCDIGNTAYTRCMCSKEKEEKAELKAREDARNELSAIRERNKSIFDAAMSLKSQAGSYTLKVYGNQGDKSVFDSNKSTALRYLGNALAKLKNAESSYRACMRVNPNRNPSECESGKQPYLAEITSLKQDINELESRDYIEETTISLGAANGDSNTIDGVEDTSESETLPDQSLYSSTKMNTLKTERQALKNDVENLWNRSDLTLEQKKNRHNQITKEKVANAKAQYAEGQRIRAEQKRESYAQKTNTDFAAESAVAALSVLYLLGGIIYQDYGQNDGDLFSVGRNNFHFGVDFGFSTSSAPVFFPSNLRMVDPNTNEEYYEELYKPGQPITINFGGKLQCGLEANNYRAEIYGGFRAGISPILTGSHTQLFYGAQLSAGVKNIKLLAGYEFGKRSYAINDWLDEDEEGKGKSNIGTRNIRAGIEISWYGSDKAFGRNHISFGLVQEQIVKLNSGSVIEYLPDGEVIVADLIYNDEGQAGYFLSEKFSDFNKFDDYKFKGVFLEWRHDHHGTLLIEFFPKYAHTGITSSYFHPDDWSKKGNFMFSIGFTRNFDWFVKTSSK